MPRPLLFFCKIGKKVKLTAMALWVSPFLAVAASAVMVALLYRFLPAFDNPLRPTSPLPPTPRLFTAQELSIYNGSDDKLPILLGILGSVFDVTKGKSHYGPGGGYSHFSGRDASRAFVSGNFTGEGLTDSLQGLSSSDVKSIVDWRDFYIRTYIFVGKLVGRYYDSQGNSTKHLKGVEAKAARGAQLMEKQKAEEANLPSCNSRWSQDEGSEVWCDNGYPRLVQRPTEIALTGKMSKRCACFNETELDQPRLEVYQGCEYLSNRCKVV
ncbi:membrane-associated progesterone-binding protein 4 [Impatiens glandulifera]|uniref:membrane-associated progesterone-binding protein 4 n=1 Tax=Impatiens glandulifera TaxID=253017 RepID=UPI001FB08372|nr:membrane-associated progesterone-binding protein 4 [Impatiens glandulifera]